MMDNGDLKELSREGWRKKKGLIEEDGVIFF